MCMPSTDLGISAAYKKSEENKAAILAKVKADTNKFESENAAKLLPPDPMQVAEGRTSGALAGRAIGRRTLASSFISGRQPMPLSTLLGAGVPASPTVPPTVPSPPTPAPAKPLSAEAKKNLRLTPKALSLLGAR